MIKAFLALFAAVAVSTAAAAQAQLVMAYWWKYYSTKDKGGVTSAKQSCADAVDSGNAGAEGHRVISEETAAALRRMMGMVMTAGTAKTAQLNGYTSGGKTGPGGVLFQSSVSR